MRFSAEVVCPIALIVALMGCVDTGKEPAQADLYVGGVAERTFVGRDGWQVELERADLAFGPLTLCPGTTAGELCETARAEWLDATVVDALSARTRRVGELIGNRGEVRSWMYDLGYVSLLSTAEPFETQAARELGGLSVLVAGCASQDARQVCFEIGTQVVQSSEAEQGVPVVRVSGGRAAVAQFGDVSRLTLNFEPQQWLAAIDFEQLIVEAGCDTSCEQVILVEKDAQATRALRSAVENTARPTLEWR